MITRRAGMMAVLMGLALTTGAATSLRIAAASNLHVVVAPLQAAFQQEHPEIQLEFSHGSSGNLVAQIRHGAPFDAFLSADLGYPAALIESGHAAAGSVQAFAIGQLVLWPHPPAGSDWVVVLRDPGVRRIAIAQPDIAPFGIAARQVLQAAGLWPTIQARIVYGENVAQALHFADSGNANYAFIAASLLVGRPQLGPGLVLPVDDENVLAHGAVVIRGRPHARAAAVFLAWLGSETAQQILVAYGYRLP